MEGIGLKENRHISLCYFVQQLCKTPDNVYIHIINCLVAFECFAHYNLTQLVKGPCNQSVDSRILAKQATPIGEDA